MEVSYRLAEFNRLGGVEKMSSRVRVPVVDKGIHQNKHQCSRATGCWSRDGQCMGTQAGPEEGTRDAGYNRARDNGSKGFVPHRESVYVYDASGDVSAVPLFLTQRDRISGQTQSLHCTNMSPSTSQAEQDLYECLLYPATVRTT